jgi:hypothetical protein
MAALVMLKYALKSNSLSYLWLMWMLKQGYNITLPDRLKPLLTFQKRITLEEGFYINAYKQTHCLRLRSIPSLGFL